MSPNKIQVRVLLVGCDMQTAGTLSHSMQNEGMHPRICSDIPSAINRLKDSKFEAVVLDFSRRAEALDLLKAIRQMNSHKGVVVIVILNGNDEMPDAFRAGTSFVLVKPLSAALLKRTLRASYPLMVREKRRYFRCSLQIPTHISIGSRPELMVTSANISEGGIAITNAPTLQLGDKVALRFQLPISQSPVKITAEVCWRDDKGRAGMEFAYIPASVKEQLVSWLADRLTESAPEETVPSI